MTEIRVLTPWHAPDADVLEAWEDFADAADEAGWRVNVEWSDPWTDEETGQELPGRFHWFLSYEAMCSDGKYHAHMLDLPETAPAQGELWLGFIEMAAQGWLAHLERTGVTTA